MPTRPSTFMRRRAQQWITPNNTVRIWSETVDADVNPDLTVATTVGYEWTGPGLARAVTDARVQSGEGRQFGQADIKVWLDEQAVPERGMRIEFITSDDATLEGRRGTVELVERDPLKAVPRIYVRMEASS